MKAFAEAVCVKVRERCPYAITDGLLRVDIMVRDDGVMVVNELESLEATYNEDININIALKFYWYLILRTLV